MRLTPGSARRYTKSDKRLPSNRSWRFVGGCQRNNRSIYFPPETPYKPRNNRSIYFPPETPYKPRTKPGYKIVVQPPGEGFRHVLTPNDVRQRLDVLPAEFCRSLEYVQLSSMTRKKSYAPCYGLQCENVIYLYPVEVDLVERQRIRPGVPQMIEAKQFGGRWVKSPGPKPDRWDLHWTIDSIRDFYLNNVLIHELGHIVDDRNGNSKDRERYAEWFAIKWGLKSRQLWPAQGGDSDLFLCPPLLSTSEKSLGT